MLIDCHMHTPLCGHAIGEPNDYVDVACARGIDLITFTCHIPMDKDDFGGPGIRMGEDQLDEYIELIGQAAKYGDTIGVEVLCGIEAEVFPVMERLTLMDDILTRHPFDFVLGSLHAALPSYRAYLASQSIFEDAAIIERYFQDLRDGVASGRYHSMSHPDVIRLYGVVNHFDPSSHETVIRSFLQAAIDNDVCIEVNTSGLIKGDYVVHPDPIILDWAAEMKVKLTLGSDSHRPESVAQKYDEVLPFLKEIGFEEVHYFREGKREVIEIAEL